MCVIPGYGGNAPAEYSPGRTNEDARSVARSAPTRQPSSPVRHCAYEVRRGTLSGTSARASAVVPCHYGLARKAADVPSTVDDPPRSPRTAHTEEAAP